MGLVSGLTDPVENVESRETKLELFDFKWGNPPRMYSHDSIEESSEAGQVVPMS